MHFPCILIIVKKNYCTFMYLRSQQVALLGRGILTKPFIWKVDGDVDSPLFPPATGVSCPMTVPKCSANPTGSPQVLGKWEAHLTWAEAPHSWHTETWRPKWIESRQTAQFVGRITICGGCNRWGMLWCILWLAIPLLNDGELWI